MSTGTVGDLSALTDGGQTESVDGLNGTINQPDTADTHGPSPQPEQSDTAFSSGFLPHRPDAAPQDKPR